MRPDAFWALVEAARAESGDDMEARVDALTHRLQALPAGDVLDFSRLFDVCMDRACTWDLWAAAWVVRGGCSDDGFADFRSSLVSMGRTVYEQALSDPESLASLPRATADCLGFEGIAYVAAAVYEEKTGNVPPREQPPSVPAGTPFDEDPDALAARFPRLWASFAGDPVGDEDSPPRPPAARRPWWRFW